MRLVRLIPHTDTPSPAVEAIEVRLERDGRWLRLRYTVLGDPAAIVWPPVTAPRRADDLWRHTCFEAFVSDGAGYVEYNLSPSGQWATYRFDDYRQGMREAAEVTENDGLDEAAGVAELQARLVLPQGAERIGLSAVIENRDGGFSYWALAHPSAKPDFHHPDSFLLELP